MTEHDLTSMSYLFARPPEPGTAMGRIEVVTSGGMASASMPAIKISKPDQAGMTRATIQDAGRTWTGTGPSAMAAVIALLADRVGYRAVVSFKDEQR